MSITIALAGNPNCGKTTMFNDLTGSNQYVGNWPGVTVEKGAVVRDSILLPESTVGAGACVERTILNENASIAADAVIGAPGKITVIGENAVMEVDV